MQFMKNLLSHKTAIQFTTNEPQSCVFCEGGKTFLYKIHPGMDPGNISLTGHSMGGTGTWNLAAAYPTLFARIAPLSGSVGNTSDTASILRNTPVWAFVGSADTIVPPESSEEVVTLLLESNADASITVFDGADHFTVPQLTYLDSSINLIGWLIGQTDHPHSDGNQASLFSAWPYSAQEDSIYAHQIAIAKAKAADVRAGVFAGRIAKPKKKRA